MMMMDDLKSADNAEAANNGANASAPNAAGASTAAASGLHYSIPGILHFLQHEWSKFEMDRAAWEVEKAELQARIAFLQVSRTIQRP